MGNVCCDSKNQNLPILDRAPNIEIKKTEKPSAYEVFKAQK